MFSPLRSRLLWSAGRWTLTGVLQRSSNGKSSLARICRHLLFLLIVRDSTIANIVSQTMNKHKSISWIIHENAPWSSAAKFMLPGNAKCSMTSLSDTKHIFMKRLIYLKPAWQAFQREGEGNYGARPREGGGRREEGNSCKEAIVFAIPPTN